MEIKNGEEIVPMLRFRILKATDHVHYLVSEEEAQLFDVLKRTTYKDSALVKNAIDIMTENKNVLRLRKRDWKANIGKVCFFDENEDLIENTRSMIHTAGRKGLKKKTGRQEALPEESKESFVKEESLFDDDTEQLGGVSEQPVKDEQPLFYDGNVEPKSVGPIPPDVATKLIQHIVDKTNDDSNANVDPEIIKQAIQEYMHSIMPEGHGKILRETPKIDDFPVLSEDEMKALDVKIAERAKHEVIDNEMKVGIHDNNPLVRAAKSMLATMENITNSETTENVAERQRRAQRRSVIVDWGMGTMKFLLYVTGLHVIESIYLAFMTVNKRLTLPSFFDVSKTLQTVLFDNPAAYIEDTCRMWYWTTDMDNMDEKITAYLNDATDAPAIERVVEQLMDLDAETFNDEFRKLSNSDRFQFVLSRMSPERLKQIWVESQREDSDPKGLFENTEFLYSMAAGSKFSKERNYIQQRGMFSNTHSYGPNASMSTMFNHAKLYQAGFTPIKDMTRIIRTVLYYMNRDFSPLTNMLGSDISELIGIVTAGAELESREYRRNLWMSVSIMALYSVPTLSYVLSVPSVIGSIYRNEWTARGVVYKLSDALLVTRMFVVSYCQAKLLSERMDDRYFSMGKSFGDAPVAWYYQMGAIQLTFQTSFKLLMNERMDNADLLEAMFLATTTLSVVASLSSDGNPDLQKDQFFNDLILIPAGSLLIAFFRLAWKAGRVLLRKYI